MVGTGVWHGGKVGSGLGVGRTADQKQTRLSPGTTVVRSQLVGATAAVAVACAARIVASAGIRVGVGDGVMVTATTSITIGVEVGANGSGVGDGTAVIRDGLVVTISVCGEAAVPNAATGVVGSKAGAGIQIKAMVKEAKKAVTSSPPMSRRRVHPVCFWLRHGAGFPQVVQNVSCMACQQPCAGP